MNIAIKFCLFDFVQVPDFSLNWQLNWFLDQTCSKMVFPVINKKIAVLSAHTTVTYFIKFFCTGADRHNGILTCLLLLVAETINSVLIKLSKFLYYFFFIFYFIFPSICRKLVNVQLYFVHLLCTYIFGIPEFFNYGRKC